MERNDVDAIISACDYDREGQLIGDRIIYRKAERESVSVTTQCMDTDGSHPRAGEYKTKPYDLWDTGISRQWADWVIRIKLTSVATLKYQKGKSAEYWQGITTNPENYLRPLKGN